MACTFLERQRQGKVIGQATAFMLLSASGRVYPSTEAGEWAVYQLVGIKSIAVGFILAGWGDEGREICVNIGVEEPCAGCVWDIDSNEGTSGSPAQWPLQFTKL